MTAEMLCSVFFTLSFRSQQEKVQSFFVHSKSLDINLKLKRLKCFSTMFFGVNPYLLSLFMCMSVHYYSRF